MKRALVADDSEAMRRIIARTVQLFGVAEVDEASNGEKAIRLHQPGKYDLVITDWHMSQVSGLEVVRSIRNKDPDVPILMVTVDTSKPHVMQAIEAGVTDYLAKPFTADMLKEKLEKILR